MLKNLFYGCNSTIAKHIAQSITSITSITSVTSLLDDCGVVAFSDTASELWGTEFLGRMVIPPSDIVGNNYDRIYICASMSYELIQQNLVEQYGISAEIIDCSVVRMANVVRNDFVKYVVEYTTQKNIVGSVAEGGVFRGAFARIINTCFSDRTLHLFDTFEGFDKRDLSSDKNFTSLGNPRRDLANTSVDIVLNNLPHPNNAVIHKGYFPETAVGIEDSFVFVNLDFDLYKPIKAGLEYFYPKMVTGGVILIHDYFTCHFDCRKAVDEFCTANTLFPMPIGDLLSVAIVKQ